MSVLVFADSSEGKFKKSAFEVVSYGKKVAEQLGSTIVAVTINVADASELYAYGAEKVISVSNDRLSSFNAKGYAAVLTQVVAQEKATVVVVDSSVDGLYLAPLLAVNLNAGYASNVVALPSDGDAFTVKRKAFSNKAFINTEINTTIKVIGLAKNSYGVHENAVSGSSESFDAQVSDSDVNVKSVSIEKATGTITIADADIVVSADHYHCRCRYCCFCWTWFKRT